MLQLREATDFPNPDATVSIVVARALLHTVEQLGVSKAALLEAVQLDPKLLDSAEALVPRAQMYRLWEIAVERTGDPALGLHWGERLDTSAFAPVSHLVKHAATLREAFELVERFQPLLSESLGFEISEQDGMTTVRCAGLDRASPVSQRFIAEMIVLGFFRLVQYFDPRVTFDAVRFAYAAPPYRAEYERLFGGAVRFEQPWSGLAFDSALLSAASPYGDDDLRDALRSVVERRALRLTESAPYAVRVRDVLAQHSSPHAIDMAAVARSLGLSERSLRRRLVAEGKPFDAILNEACAIVVKRLLLEQGRTIQEAAFEMGFSSTTAFHRAFKRWIGTTPNELRKRQWAGR